jgi:hypothetical protein
VYFGDSLLQPGHYSISTTWRPTCRPFSQTSAI